MIALLLLLVLVAAGVTVGRDGNFRHSPNSRRLSPGDGRRLHRWRFGSPTHFSHPSCDLRIAAGRREIRLDSESSLLVVGPTRSGKTRSVVAPNLTRWNGPLLYASVKDELLNEEVLSARSAFGAVYVLGPSPRASASWWPALEANSAAAAQRMANIVISVHGGNGIDGTETRFWYGLAEPVLAGLLRAANLAGIPESEVASSPALAERLLEKAGEGQLASEVAGAGGLDQRTRSSVLLTVKQLLDPLSRIEQRGPAVALSDLLPGSVLLVGSIGQQQEAAIYLSTFISAYLRTVLEPGAGAARLLLLDEAAHLSRVPELAAAASVGIGLGIRMVTVVQDLSQLAARYRDGWRSIVSNHTAQLFLGTGGDGLTRDYLTQAFGGDPPNGKILLERRRRPSVIWELRKA